VARRISRRHAQIDSLNVTDVVIMGKALGAAMGVPYICTGKLIAWKELHAQFPASTSEIIERPDRTRAGSASFG
jgi:hypothetical protein